MGGILFYWTFQVEEKEKDAKIKEAEKVAAALGVDEDDDEEESTLFFDGLMPLVVSVLFTFDVIALISCV